MVSSERGYHLVQIADVMVDVRKMSQLKSRSSKSKGQSLARGAGILGGALAAAQEGIEYKRDLTYKIETMGCQMNLADIERMEGQLQSLGVRALEESNITEKKHPDLVVKNTCSVRDNVAKRKREGKDLTVMSLHSKKARHRAPEVDF